MRLFFAVSLSNGVREIINSSIESFPVPDPPWKWVPAGNLHVTLKFLGEMPESKIEDLVANAIIACSSLDSFSLEFEDFGAFPSFKRPRVLFFSAKRGRDKLELLASRLEEQLNKGMNINKERRSFKAHVTIARIRSPLPEETCRRFLEVPSLKGAGQEVRSIVLMRSILKREGAEYHPVKEIALGGIK